jgi:hypothetical protein
MVAIAMSGATTDHSAASSLYGVTAAAIGLNEIAKIRHLGSTDFMSQHEQGTARTNEKRLLVG